MKKLVSRYRKTQSVADRPRSGRPRLTTQSQNNLLRQIALQNRFDDLKTLANKFNHLARTNISQFTVRRILHKYDLSRRIAARRPLVNNIQKAKRLAYAKKYIRQSISLWSQYKFSDEKIFSTSNNTRSSSSLEKHPKNSTPNA